MTYDCRVAAQATITRSEALSIFGLKAPIGLTELKFLYRKKSLESHEDHGGTKEQSQRLNEAYDVLRGAAIPKPEPASYDYRGGPEPGWGYRPGPNSNPWGEAARRERDERAERARKERTDEQQRRRQERQDAEDRQRAKERAERPGVVPREAVARARARMYDAYDRAFGDPSFKFNKMLIALKTRIRAITDPAKLAGVVEMLRQETTEPQFMKRWSHSEIAVLKQIWEILSR